MSASSQFAAAASSIPASAADVFDTLLSDTNPATLTLIPVANGATLLLASAGNGDTNVAVTAPTSSVAGSVTSGSGQNLQFQLAAGVGFASKEMTTNSTSTADAYVEAQVGRYFSITETANSQVAALKSSLSNALDTLLTNPQFGSGTTVIRVFDFYSGNSAAALDASALLDDTSGVAGADSLLGAQDVLLDAGSSAGQQLFVVNLAGLSGKALTLQNVEGAMLASSGTVRVEGSTPIVITSDNQPQRIIGGSGNDTLIGTGSDTLTGGAGNDLFGFSGAGRYTVTDFSTSNDRFAFNMPGVTNIDQLKAQVTGVSQTAVSVTYQLGPDLSVTLVGVNPNELLASMFQFTLT